MVLIETLVNGVIQGSIYAVFAASFTIIFGVMDIPNMSHAALFAGGAYIFYQFADLMGLPWPIGAVVAIIVIGILGAVIEISLLSKLYERDESEYIFGVILVTLGAARILERLYAQIWGFEPIFLNIATLQDNSVTISSISMNYLELVVFFFGIGTFAFLYWLINYTELGLSLRAIVQDRELAHMRGVNVDRVFLYAFMLGSSMAAGAGILNAAMYTLSPTMGFNLLIKAFIIIILGGIGRVLGAAVAGYALGIYEAFAILSLSSYYIYASEFAILILFFVAKAAILGEGEESLSKAIGQRINSLFSRSEVSP